MFRNRLLLFLTFSRLALSCSLLVFEFLPSSDGCLSRFTTTFSVDFRMVTTMTNVLCIHAQRFRIYNTFLGTLVYSSSNQQHEPCDDRLFVFGTTLSFSLSLSLIANSQILSGGSSNTSLTNLAP
jgi:hypothetical protein